MEASLAIGVEKTFVQGDAAKTLEIFEGGIDQLDPEEWHAYYKLRGAEAGKPFDPNGAGGTVFMDTYAMQAAWHMKTYGTTQEQIAMAASKNHWHGSMNPKAQYRFEVPVADALRDRQVSWPITRSMAAPIGDGAAAAILVSGDLLQQQPAQVRARAIKVRGSVLTGGKYRDPTEPGLSRIAAQKAYAKSGLTPADVDLVELHDATSFCEIFQLEMLGFAADGDGGKLVQSGATQLGGRLPVNLSGGLVSKGHPVGATGLSMIHELALQLRGEAGARQTDKARIAMAENGGGVIGFDEAACSVILLEAPAG
jgi:acetyl-CoA acetyltransferase